VPAPSLACSPAPLSRCAGAEAAERDEHCPGRDAARSTLESFETELLHVTSG
jgi:hypothetical protein